MAAIWNSPWDKDNEFYNKVLASGQYWNDFDLAHASQDQNFANTIFNAKTDYDNATTDEGRALANANAEAARRGYNYTSGSFGAEYNPFNQNNSQFWGDEMLDAYGNVKGAPSFTYEKFQAPDPFTYEDFQAPAPFQYEAYQNNTPDWQHSDPYNNAYNNVLNYGDFSYDYTTDPLYDVYAKEYTREGRRASEDALAQAAAMTGGVPSSYANMVGQQAGNYYASQLADKIPELRAQAYNEYQNAYNQLLSKYNVANGHDQFDYGVYSDKLNRDYKEYLDKLNFDYGVYRDNYNDAYKHWGDKLAFDYGLYSDDYNRAYNQWQDEVNLDHAINNENYQRLLDTYGMANDNFWNFHGEDREDAAAADAKKLDFAKLLAQFGDYSGLDEYYGGNGKLTNLYAQMQEAQATPAYRYYSPTQEEPANNEEPEENKITKPDQLGTKAKSILEEAMGLVAFGNNAAGAADYVAEQIEKMHGNGLTTEEEDYLFGLFGV